MEEESVQNDEKRIDHIDMSVHEDIDQHMVLEQEEAQVKETGEILEAVQLKEELIKAAKDKQQKGKRAKKKTNAE